MVDLTQTQLDFREGMSRLGAAVNLITSDGPAGQHGLVASAVCSVTDQPPTLLVCINKNAFAHDKFVENGVLAVNVLASEHQALSGHFARYVEGVDRFSYGEWVTAQTGSPMLADANVAFDCRITSRHEEGTHSVLFCQVEAVRLSEEARHGLVWFSRDYHHLTVEQA
ncbi:MAG: flavin reductase [Rhodobacteraceae bacterium]|uniref:flavin reductase n=1 Tax=Celeribacter sp. HF31 TaxID=2721558 RepID=UPI001431753B|nr:flavin reductase [Celeribacter sp. HF31]NIY81286.1 flavin reductase [Celeribacter sp. HF31]NVK47323.1 flavin reductase [Paracoccaceae bacterium]